jgi:hypothetical protein
VVIEGTTKLPGIAAIFMPTPRDDHHNRDAGPLL